MSTTNTEDMRQHFGPDGSPARLDGGTAGAHCAPVTGSDGWRAFDDAREHVEKRLRFLKNPPPTSAALAESPHDKECRRLMISELEWVLEQFFAEARWHGHPNVKDVPRR